MAKLNRHDDIWYHWSPRDRRSRIQRMGLMPGVWDRHRMWRPPYVCLAESPHVAWALSGGMHGRSEFTKEWDLWEVRTHEQTGFETLWFDDTGNIKEIRVYERIYKRNVWFVGERNI